MAYRQGALMKSYLSTKMIILKMKMMMQQKEQSHPNVTTRKYLKEQIVNSLHKVSRKWSFRSADEIKV